MVGPGRMEKTCCARRSRARCRDEILWRQKEQFSDGVGYSWIDSLKAIAEVRVSATQMESARYRFPYNPPATKEAYLYRDIFESHFPGEAAAACVPGGPSIACSHADRDRLGRQLRRQRRPLGPRGARRPP